MQISVQSVPTPSPPPHIYLQKTIGIKILKMCTADRCYNTQVNLKPIKTSILAMIWKTSTFCECWLAEIKIWVKNRSENITSHAGQAQGLLRLNFKRCLFYYLIMCNTINFSYNNFYLKLFFLIWDSKLLIKLLY